MRHTRLLARDVLWNLVGQGAPVIVAFFAIPVLTRGLGADRFGVLALAWVFLGYFSLFDLGLGRALTQAISERYGRDEIDEVPAITSTSLAVMAMLGVVGAALAGIGTPLLVRHVLKVPVALQPETQRAFYAVAASIPAVILTAGLRGVLEARHRFDLSNALRIPLNLVMLLVPLAVLPFSHDLGLIIGLLFLVRAAAMLVHAYFVGRVIPGIFVRPVLRREVLRPVMTLGSWITVSSVISALLSTLDRFVLGAAASLSAVTYYTAPFEAVTKIWVLPGAISGALFPEFAATNQRDKDRGARLYRRAVVALLLILFPITLVIVAGARMGLRFWLGPVFAERSTLVLQVLAAGVLINSIAYVPFSMIQGVGRPELAARLHLIEIGPFLVLLWVLIARFGINGAAIAWATRCAIDSAVMFAIARHMLPKSHASLVPLAGACAIAGVILAMAALPSAPIVRVLLVAIGAPLFVIGGAMVLLDSEDRRAIVARLPFRRVRVQPAGD